MLKNIQNKFDLAIYGYQEGEFLPIRYDGQVTNWDAFIIYKLRRVARRLPALQ